MDIEKEVEMCIERINKQRENCDGENDYIVGCLQSALKAYKSMSADGHSGLSWSVTKNLLMRMLDDMPLSEITAEDEWGDERSLDGRRTQQCLRYTALFRDVMEDGSYKYTDIYRCTSKNGWGCGMVTNEIDKRFPITLPYYPSTKKYVGDYVDFSTDGKVGVFDTRYLKSITTPSGEVIEIEKYQKEGLNNEWIDITKEEYEERKQMFIDNCGDEYYINSCLNIKDKDKETYAAEPDCNA